MRVRLILIGVIACLSGCINLPPEVARELTCPSAQAPDNYGSAATCKPADER